MFLKRKKQEMENKLYSEKQRIKDEVEYTNKKLMDLKMGKVKILNEGIAKRFRTPKSRFGSS